VNGINPTNSMDITQIVPMIDKASTASFQWLFVVVLALFLGFSYMVFRHLVMQSSILAQQSREDSVKFVTLLREDSAKFAGLLLEINARSAERSEKHTAVIAENTVVIGQAKHVMDRINSNLCKV
jgi:hypothetical protein